MPFEALNTLEASLVKASTDPAHRPQFYRDFTQSDIYVPQPGTDAGARTEEAPLRPGEQVKVGFVTIQDVQYIPVFTSLPRLEAWINKPILYLRANALEFIRLTQAAPLILNPGADYGKTITATEAVAVLDGSIWGPLSVHKTEKSTQVLLGQPSVYPEALVERLTGYFQTKPQVTRAWFCLMGSSGPAAETHTLVGVEAHGNFDEVLSELSIVLSDVSVPNPPVDLIPVNGSGGVLEDYLVNETKPFYEARSENSGLLGSMKRLFKS